MSVHVYHILNGYDVVISIQNVYYKLYIHRLCVLFICEYIIYTGYFLRGTPFSLDIFLGERRPPASPPSTTPLGTRALGALIYKNKVVDLTYQTYTIICNMCVLLVITYCSSVWDIKNISKIITVQDKAMRKYICVNTYTSNCCTIGDMGWTDISIIIKMNMLKFWSRLIQLPDTRLVKGFFLLDYNIYWNGP